MLVSGFPGAPGVCFLGFLSVCCSGAANYACLWLSWRAWCLFSGISASVLLWSCKLCLFMAFLARLVFVFWDFCLCAALKLQIMLVYGFPGAPGVCFLGFLPLCCSGAANYACLWLSWRGSCLFSGISASVLLWSCKLCLFMAFLARLVFVFWDFCLCAALELQIMLVYGFPGAAGWCFLRFVALYCSGDGRYALVWRS